MNRIKCLYCLVSLVLLSSCVKPFEFDFETYDRVVVVDASFTSELKKHQVLLSYTFPLEDSVREQMSGAQVWVCDDLDNKIEYIEINPGVYETKELVAAQLGRQYQLSFTLSDGKAYASFSEELNASPTIDSIYHVYAELPVDDSEENLAGIQFMLDTHSESDQVQYFRYTWDETYEINTFKADIEYLPKIDSFQWRTEFPFECFKSDKSKIMIIGESAGDENNRVAEQPIRFVSEEELLPLVSRYSILVRQYAISASAHSFYKKIKEAAESGGSLFDQQQGTIVGNIYSADNPNETVLGYFEVSDVSSKRVFVNSDEVDQRVPVLDRQFVCDPLTQVRFEDRDGHLDSAKYYYELEKLDLIGIEFEYSEGGRMIPVIWTMAPETCIDCRFHGSIERPEFWID
ncbi:MAG: DUF4249 domain-containing protein [Cyclobacteriaceae bacterium]